MDLFFIGDDALYCPGQAEDLDSLEAFFERRISSNELVLSTSPSVADSGIDSASFETTFTDSDATLTTETTDESEGMPAVFSQLYESMTCFNEEEFDGVDSPKRLYNRKPSAQFSKTEDEVTKDLIVKMSKLSTTAAEFVPMSKSNAALKQATNVLNPLGLVFMEYQKLFSSLNCSTWMKPSSAQGCATSTPLKPRPNRVSNGPICLFCKRSGFGRHVITSHSLRNPVTKEIICPNLKDDVCQNCGPTDEDWLLHTTEQCVQSSRINVTNNGFINFK